MAGEEEGKEIFKPEDGGGAHPGHGASPELIERWLENQNKQIEAKARETELQFQQDNHAFEFGKLSLDAQGRDRIHERTNSRKSQRDKMVFVFAIILVIAVLVAVALFLNKDEIALELVKAVIYVTAGAVGGYGYARTKPKGESDISAGTDSN